MGCASASSFTPDSAVGPDALSMMLHVSGTSIFSRLTGLMKTFFKKESANEEGTVWIKYHLHHWTYSGEFQRESVSSDLQWFG